jgi:signal transduction histidine kinase
MTKSAAAIGPLNIHDRIEEPPIEDELKELSVTFNNLLDRLDDAYMKQAKFVSDASHELRTPLTVIKGYNDMLYRWGKDDPEILDEAIMAIRQETQNMHMLVENLLFSAKGENQKIKLEMTSFSILELLEETIKDYRLSVKERTFDVVAENFEVHQDRRMIKQLLRILIDNSLKFTKDGDTITVMAKKEPGQYALSVKDPGEGILEKELVQIFERFYVADKARTKDKAGSGLGLSIAKWIVEIHEGAIKASSTPFKETEIKAIFPRKKNLVEPGL